MHLISNMLRTEQQLVHPLLHIQHMRFPKNYVISLIAGYRLHSSLNQISFGLYRLQVKTH